MFKYLKKLIRPVPKYELEPIIYKAKAFRIEEHSLDNIERMFEDRAGLYALYLDRVEHHQGKPIVIAYSVQHNHVHDC